MIPHQTYLAIFEVEAADDTIITTDQQTLTVVRHTFELVLH